MITNLILTVLLLSTPSQQVPVSQAGHSGGKAVMGFIPRGWKFQEEVTGDLNGDGLPDSVLQMIEDNNMENRSRGLMILLQTTDGKFSRVAFTKHLIIPFGGGGMLEGDGSRPFADVTIKEGALIVHQLVGSADSTETEVQFRLESKSKKFVLVHKEITNRDRRTGNSKTISTNYTTGNTNTIKRKFNISNNTESIISQKTKRLNLSSTHVLNIEIIKYDDLKSITHIKTHIPSAIGIDLDNRK